MKHGGKRKNAGRPKGVTKINRTYSLDLDMVENNEIKSSLVNGLLKEHFKTNK